MKKKKELLAMIYSDIEALSCNGGSEEEIAALKKLYLEVEEGAR